MHPSNNNGEVILQLGQGGITFAVADQPLLTFAHQPSTSKPWMRFLVSFLVSLGFWSVPMFTQASTTTSADLVARANQIRIEHGVAALTNNSVLEQAAIAKANDMLSHQYFAHTSPTGTTPWSFFTSAGYRFTSAAENLALEPSATADPTAAWMSSSAHRQNILDPKFHDIGMAVVSGTYEGKPTTFIVQLFGSRKSAISAPAPLPTATITPKATQPTVAPPAPLPSPNVEALAVPTEITTQTRPSTVLGATTQVIHSNKPTRIIDPQLSGKITALLVQVMGIYFLVVGAFGLLQLTEDRQKKSFLLAAEPLPV